jgi:hypothetical protein
MAEKKYTEAYRLAERLCRIHLPPGTLDRHLIPAFTEATVEQWRARWMQNPSDTNVLHALAEAIYHLPGEQRDLPLLRQLAAQPSAPPRLIFLVAQTEWDAGHTESAARRMLALTERVMAPVMRAGR